MSEGRELDPRRLGDRLFIVAWCAFVFAFDAYILYQGWQASWDLERWGIALESRKTRVYSAEGRVWFSLAILAMLSAVGVWMLIFWYRTSRASRGPSR